MANVQGAFGLRPVRHVDGTPWNGATIPCYVSATYATALYIGDPVLWTPTLAEKDATAKMPTINVSSGASATMIRGVITSFEPLPANLTLQYNPASTARIANVCVATPDLIFQIRDDGDATPTSVFPGQNAICAYAAGSAITGLSGVYLDGSTTPTTTQAHSLHIVALADIVDNELGDYAIWDVIVNTSRNATGTFLGVSAA